MFGPEKLFFTSEVFDDFKILSHRFITQEMCLWVVLLLTDFTQNCFVWVVNVLVKSTSFPLVLTRLGVMLVMLQFSHIG